MSENGKLRYWAVGFGSGLAALGGVLQLTQVEYWATVATVIGIAAADMIKHRND